MDIQSVVVPTHIWTLVSDSKQITRKTHFCAWAPELREKPYRYRYPLSTEKGTYR
jgi:hypothetical protein